MRQVTEEATASFARRQGRQGRREKTREEKVRRESNSEISIVEFEICTFLEYDNGRHGGMKKYKAK
jgi:hypothetical protein